MRSRFAYRSRFPKNIEGFVPRAKKSVQREKPPIESAGYICPKCFKDFATAEERKAHRPGCAADRLAARSAKIEPRLAKMTPRQRERAEKAIRDAFLQIVLR